MNNNKPTVPDLAWMRIAAQTKPDPEWSGDLSDDCTALWAGFMLRAECMDEGVWWWATYLNEPDIQIASSNDSDALVATGEEARRLALHAARKFLNSNENA